MRDSARCHNWFKGELKVSHIIINNNKIISNIEISLQRYVNLVYPQDNNKPYSTVHKYLPFYTQELFALNQFSIIFRVVK